MIPDFGDVENRPASYPETTPRVVSGPRTQAGRTLLDGFAPAPLPEAQELHRRSAQGRRDKLLLGIVAIEDEAAASPEPTPGLREALERLASWDEMAGNGDPEEFPTLYRQEIAARINLARAALAASPAPEPTGLDAAAIEAELDMHNMLHDGRCDCGDHDDWPMTETFNHHVARALAARLTGEAERG